MPRVNDADPWQNPFSTCFTQPGALEFDFAGSGSVAQLVDQLRDQGWWGQIVGAHGTGKSTLLAALAPALRQAGRQLITCALHAGERQLPAEQRTELRECPQQAVLVVDGYEQLRWWTRKRLQWQCRHYSCGLLVTTHRDCHLPTLYQTKPDLQLVQHLVARLQRGGPQRVGEADVARCFAPARRMFVRPYSHCMICTNCAARNASSLALAASRLGWEVSLSVAIPRSLRRTLHSAHAANLRKSPQKLSVADLPQALSQLRSEPVIANLCCFLLTLRWL